VEATGLVVAREVAVEMGKAGKEAWVLGVVEEKVLVDKVA